VLIGIQNFVVIVLVKLSADVYYREVVAAENCGADVRLVVEGYNDILR
jgi:hypothetical protein